jgi:hypothetical protein
VENQSPNPGGRPRREASSHGDPRLPWSRRDFLRISGTPYSVPWSSARPPAGHLGVAPLRPAQPGCASSVRVWT